MTSNLNPYLTFDGNAREAMEFYRDALGGELKVDTFGDAGVDGPGADRIMHARLETAAGYLLMASDTAPGMEFHPGDNIAVSISGSAADADALRGYWAKLSAGGTVTVPMATQSWGDEFGSCRDRYGIGWMVDIRPE